MQTDEKMEKQVENNQVQSLNLENNSNPNKKSRFNNEKLSLEDFENVGSLGNGSFGEVSLVKKKGSEQHYAMKSINKNFLFKVKIYIFLMIIAFTKGKKTISSLY